MRLRIFSTTQLPISYLVLRAGSRQGFNTVQLCAMRALILDVHYSLDLQRGKGRTISALRYDQAEKNGKKKKDHLAVLDGDACGTRDQAQEWLAWKTDALRIELPLDAAGF